MIAVHFWIGDNKVNVAQHRIFAGLLQGTITGAEMQEMCDANGFVFEPQNRTPWLHTAEEVRRSYNFHSPWSGYGTSSYYFEGRQFTPQQLMAETPAWIAFLDDLNTVAHNRIADNPDAIPFTTTNIFRSMLTEDGTIDPVVRLVESLRVEYGGVTYTLDPEGLQPISGSDRDITGPLRATASALQEEFERKATLLTRLWDKRHAPNVALTPRMVRKGFVTFMDGAEQVLVKRVTAHKTQYFVVRGARYQILPGWQATNNFFLCCKPKNSRAPGTFYLLTGDLDRPFFNAHTGASGVPCLGTAKLTADENDPLPWETIFDSALAALGVINFSSLNDWQVMSPDRLEHKIIEAARAAPGWPSLGADGLASMIRSGGLPFCDPAAEPIEGWE